MILFLHVVAAAYWVGGNLLFFVALRRARPEDRLLLYQALGRPFRTSSWLAVAVLVATGLVLLQDFPAHLYRTKFVLVGLAVALKAFHDFGVAPRARKTGRHRPVRVLAYTLLILELWILFEAVNV